MLKLLVSRLFHYQLGFIESHRDHWWVDMDNRLNELAVDCHSKAVNWRQVSTSAIRTRSISFLRGLSGDVEGEYESAVARSAGSNRQHRRVLQELCDSFLELCHFHQRTRPANAHERYVFKLLECEHIKERGTGGCVEVFERPDRRLPSDD